MENWKSGVIRAMWAYQHRDKFAYLYGCKGDRIVSRKQFDRYIKAEKDYFSRYTKEQLDDIYSFCYGKYCYDCSGFVAWLCYPQLKKYSTALYSYRKAEFTDYTQSISGGLLYTTFGGSGRHVAIDIGNGYWCDMAVEMDSVRMHRFSDTPNYFEKFFAVDGVDYTGATAHSIENILNKKL